MQTVVFTYRKAPQLSRNQTCHKAKNTSRKILRAIILLAAAEAAVRVVMFMVMFAATRDGMPGGEITLPIYMAIIGWGGWELRGWVEARKRST